MKKALCVLAILAMAVTATASVRVFVTTSSDGYGLTIPSNHNVPTNSDVDTEGTNLNAYDYYYGAFVCNSYPPEAALSGTIATPVEILEGDWAYIWIQFQSEPKNAQISGLKVEITGPGGFYPTYYVQNDKGGAPSKKRWDGTANSALGYPEWHNNPQTMVAVTAFGLVNGLDDPQMMFDSQSGSNPRTGVALIGAVDLTAGGLYHIDITDINYGNFPNPTSLGGGVFHYTPEPASLLLMALAGLIMRRR